MRSTVTSASTGTNRRIVRVAAIVLGLAVLALVADRMRETMLNALSVFSDYHAYYRAAVNIRDGSDIYAEAKLLLERNSIHFWSQTDGQYVYPPLLALALRPLVFLTMSEAAHAWLMALATGMLGFIWAAAQVLGRRLRYEIAIPAITLLVASLPVMIGVQSTFDRTLTGLAMLALLAGAAAFTVAWAITRRFAWPNREDLRQLPALLPICIVVLGSAPLALGLKFGQSDIIITLLTTLALLCYLKRQDVIAGILLGLAASVKPTVALYGIFYLKKGRWLTIGAATVTGLLLGLGPFAPLISASLGDWLAISRYFTGDDYPIYPSNQSLHGWLMRLFVGGEIHQPLLQNRLLADVLWVTMAAGALALWWRSVSNRPERGGRAVIEYALTTVLILFAAPLAEDIHFVALLLPMVILADQVIRDRMPLTWKVLAVLACLYYMQPWLDSVPWRGEGTTERLLASGFLLYGLFLVGPALLLLLRRLEHEPVTWSKELPEPGKRAGEHQPATGSTAPFIRTLQQDDGTISSVEIVAS